MSKPKSRKIHLPADQPFHDEDQRKHSNKNDENYIKNADAPPRAKPRTRSK